MSVLEIVLIGVALAMDAFALTIANCTVYRKSLDAKKEWAMPVCFAAFQFAMPLIGYFFGSLFSSQLSAFSKYLTMAIFFLLALKIVLDNISELQQSDKEQTTDAPFTFKILILQGFATSIDALAIGVTFAAEIKFSIYFASLIIGVITFFIVTVALLFGKYLKKLFGKYAQWLGAAILLALAIKALIEALA